MTIFQPSSACITNVLIQSFNISPFAEAIFVWLFTIGMLDGWVLGVKDILE